MNYPIGDPSFDAAKGNIAQALVWYELLDIARHHNKLARVMTSSQIAEAQKLAREWRAAPER